MLTPQEVSERAFPKASFGGYNMAAVDDFLDILTADYTNLYNDNAVLKSKMKVLVDKVEEYRATEEAMRKALMSAQRMADQMVAEAEEKKAALLRDAEREAADRATQLRRETQEEESRLAAAKNETAAYVEKLRALHAKELEYLDNLSLLVPATTAEPVVEDNTARDIEDSVQRILEAQMAAIRQQVQEENDPMENTCEFAVDKPEPSLFADDEPEAEEDPDDGVVHRDFGKLEFGRDYEIK